MASLVNSQKMEMQLSKREFPADVQETNMSDNMLGYAIIETQCMIVHLMARKDALVLFQQNKASGENLQVTTALCRWL